MPLYNGLPYWPMANVEGEKEPLFTYDSVRTLNEAKQVIKKWCQQFAVTEAWVDQFEGDKKITTPIDLKELQ